MKRILLLNGPPRSGKDTMAEYLEETLGWHHGKFSKVLKERTHALYGMDLPYNYFEASKDDKMVEFAGITPRQAYINTSEMLMKPVHGADIWARMFAKELETIDNDYIVISDLGFQVEWETFMKMFGYENLSLCLLYRDGCDFSIDSRDYVAPRGPWQYHKDLIPTSDVQADFDKYLMGHYFDIANEGSLDDLYHATGHIADVMMGKVAPAETKQGLPIGAVANAKVSG